MILLLNFAIFSAPFRGQGDHGDGSTDHDTDHETRVTALISNGLGYIYRRADQTCPAGSGQFSLSSTGLRKGQYIIYIHVDGNQYAEKVNVK